MEIYQVYPPIDPTDKNIPWANVLVFIQPKQPQKNNPWLVVNSLREGIGHLLSFQGSRLLLMDGYKKGQKMPGATLEIMRTKHVLQPSMAIHSWPFKITDSAQERVHIKVGSTHDSERLFFPSLHGAAQALNNFASANLTLTAWPHGPGLAIHHEEYSVHLERRARNLLTMQLLTPHTLSSIEWMKNEVVLIKRPVKRRLFWGKIYQRSHPPYRMFKEEGGNKEVFWHVRPPWQEFGGPDLPVYPSLEALKIAIDCKDRRKSVYEVLQLSGLRPI